MNIRDFIEELIPDEAEDFAEFVWGKNYRTCQLRGKGSIKHWNDNHGDKLMIYPDGLISIDIPKMIMIWRNQRM